MAFAVWKIINYEDNIVAGAQMNGVHPNGKARGSEKAVPGCLGRMVNLFDLTSGVSSNRLLTDKPHNDGSLSRSRSDVSRMSSITGDDMEDKVMVTELSRPSSNRKPNGTPVKMLIAQEIAKDLELRHNSPNVVAKLMGLDALPNYQADRATQRTHSKCYTRKCHSEIPIGYWQEEDSAIHAHQVQNEFKDIHEIFRHSQRTNCRRDKSPQKGRSNEIVNEKRLALIRQKFMEAKRLATDEKLRQTKEFQDALDILSSNGDLFLKVFQEPNSLFTQHLYGGHSIPLSPETKKITVLRPSKMMADDICTTPARRDEKHPNGFSATMSKWKVNDSQTQPIRIVVLKPNPAKVNGSRTAESSTPPSPHAQKSINFFDEEAREAREVAKEITQKMRENLAVLRRDETLLSSVFSNGGYIGDESSFEKSETEFADGNLSDSDVMSPTLRHSWDYVNRFGSPYSIPSFSRASFSPESSVCREAKKRLSERWAMMANGSNHEKKQFHRSASTLGEMLALSEIKKPEICEEGFDNKDEDPTTSTSCLDKSVDVRESGEYSPKNLMRSKSVPISSTAYGERLNVEVCDPLVCKVDVRPEEIMKAKAPKASFTGKVTSLFFSRNKNPKKYKSRKLQSNNELQLASGDTLGSLPPLERTSDYHSEVVLSPLEVRSGTVSVDMNDKSLSQGFHQGALSVSQPCPPGIQGGNQDQPSPISVLEQSFEEEEAGKPQPLGLSKSNLIDKSPPIGSIARTLSWDESCTETATIYPLNSPYVSPGAENDEGEWLYLVQSLLTMAGLNNEGQLGLNLTRWHTPESPLDPLLRDKYIDLTAEEPVHEAKRRRLRSSQKLVFDSVSAALVNIIGFGTPTSQWSMSCVGAHSRFLESGSTTLVDKVWARIKEWWLFGEVKYILVESGDSNSLIERLVMKEVVGPGWGDQLNLEMDKIGKEVEEKLLEELIEESLADLTGRD